MPLSVTAVRPGPAGAAWLFGRVAAAQRSDRLAPVTVVVPTAYTGLALRRALARHSFINVRFAVLARLAEMLGAPRLAREGRVGLTGATSAAVVREAVRNAAPELAQAIAHLSLVVRIAALDLELRRRDPGQADLRGAGQMARAVLRACAECDALKLAHGLYDEVDLLTAAAAATGDGGTDAVLRDVGTVIVFLPARLGVPETRLIEALAARLEVVVALPELADPLVEAQRVRHTRTLGVEPPPPAEAAPQAGPGVQVTIAPDPPEEVRAAVRCVLAGLEVDPPVALHDTAILYRDAETYGRLLRDTLRAAGLTYAALDGRPLSESVAGRGLIGLLRLRDDDFSRAAVVEWLGGLPHDRGHRFNAPRWDALSREAGVVRGVDQWRQRLRGLAAELRERAERQAAKDDPNESAVDFLRRRAEEAGDVVARIEEIDRLSTPPAAPTWPAFAGWARSLLTRFLPPEPSWGEAELEAAQLVHEVVDGLAGAGRVEPVATIDNFLVALADALQTRHRPEGRLGDGVVIGPIGAALGMSFSRVHILGMTERAFPAPAPVDPLFGGEDPLASREDRLAFERLAYLAALAAADGGSVHLSTPTRDADGRPVYPSPWLVDQVAAMTGEPVTATGLRKSPPGGHPLIHVTFSAEAGLVGAAASLNLAERRTAEIIERWRGGRKPSSSPLARSVDAGLAGTLAVLAARRSAALTEYDGNLAAVAASVASLGVGIAGETSATTIESWATCPFRHLMGNVLHVKPTERPEEDDDISISARERGALVHEILERFFRDLAETGRAVVGAAYTPADHARMEEIARACFAAAERRGVTGNAIMWANVQAALLRDLHTLLRNDERWREEAGLAPRYFEQRFGFAGEDSWPRLVVPLDAERAVRMRGLIDRIDLDGAQTRALVIDYKTGKADTSVLGAADLLRAGTRIQLAVYAAAVRGWAQEQGLPLRNVEAIYWYVSEYGRFAAQRVVHSAALDRALGAVVATMDEAVRSGAFPQVPGGVDEWKGGWTNCTWCAFDRVCPSGRDAVWERKRADPTVEPYLRLRVVPEDGE